MSDTGEAMLEVRAVTVRFGGLTAVDSVSLAVGRGQRYGLLGPNGAGKTTLFNAISGFVPTTAGTILVAQQDITSVAPHRRARTGLVRTFQITELCRDLTVFENVALATVSRAGMSWKWWRATTRLTEPSRLAMTTLEQLGLVEVAWQPVSSLGYGQQRQVEFAVALASEPSVLLLDEPTAGLSAADTSAVVEVVVGLPEELTVLVIEHDVNVIATLTDHLVVLDRGRVVAGGPADEVRANPLVREVYFGSHAD